MTVNFENAADQAARLARTKGYPHPLHDRRGFEALVSDIMDVCEKYRIEPDKLISECDGEHCPTKPDLQRIGQLLSERDIPPAVAPRSSACPKCHGTGFELMYEMHTVERGKESNFTRKGSITAEQYELLSRQVDWVTQRVYRAARKCTAGCQAPGVRVA